LANFSCPVRKRKYFIKLFLILTLCALCVFAVNRTFLLKKLNTNAIMKLVLQRVSSASVEVDGKEIASVGKGLMVLFGAEKGDTLSRADFLAGKTVNLRIFPDAAGKMNLSLQDIEGEILVVSQFTLAGDCSKGRRPGFDKAALPADAETLYLRYVEVLTQSGCRVAIGKFGADMQVQLVNDGPVTFILD
jgi:D-aminoacyl-tRNA deacylase